VTDDVFEARGITKVYRMGEVEVHALRGIDLTLSCWKRSSASAASWGRRSW